MPRREPHRSPDAPSRLIVFGRVLPPCLIGTLVTVALAIGGTPAVAQDQQPEEPKASGERVWEFEGHAGLEAYRRATAGSGTLPVSGAIVGGLISASSFYFGSAAQLFNQNQIGLGGSSVPTITPLDPILVGSAVRPQAWTGTAGLRVERTLRGRLSIEMTGDYRWRELAFADTALGALETTRASFTRALTGALADRSIPSTVSSVLTLSDHRRAAELLASGAVVMRLKKEGKTIPYLVGGGGAIFHRGDTPSALLEGNYQFGAVSQVLGRDSVALTYSLPDRDYFGLGGAGLKYYTAGRWGVRVDGRVQLVSNGIENLITAAPARALESAGAPFPIIRSGALQFSSTAPLTGAAIASATTFAGRGVQVQMNIAAGLFLRF